MPTVTFSSLPLPKIGKAWRKHHRSSSPHSETQPLLERPFEESRRDSFLGWNPSQRSRWTKLPDLARDDELYALSAAIVPKLLNAERRESSDHRAGAKNISTIHVHVPPPSPRKVNSSLSSIPNRSKIYLGRTRGSKSRLRANQPIMVQLRIDHRAYQPKGFLPPPLSPIKEDSEFEEGRYHDSYKTPRIPPGLHGIKEELEEGEEEEDLAQQQCDISHNLAATINPFDDFFGLEYEEMDLADISLLKDALPSASGGVNVEDGDGLALKEFVNSKQVQISMHQSLHSEQTVEYSV
ncbi:hypothetical protein CPB84DRAFT_1788006 [Gymnopilus junonius]|uniref:Uncharacterized protein n=1 Tax=Gymnopilus junonius TaxID=109634 RepID=A0A9P5NH34_GYMJU|nr:hypothetical protein CPB84DRAFT_1788006 [Gymnopilus junonius]